MKKIVKFSVAAALVAAALLAAAPVFAQEKVLILATTTSTQDSGLLDVLVPAFEKQSGLMVKTIAVGSGQAMAMGRKGEADVLLVHSPEAEEKFVAEGFGMSRRLVMHNDFVIVGPAADPAKIKGIEESARGAQGDRREAAAPSSRAATTPGPTPRRRGSGRRRRDRRGAEVVPADRPRHGATLTWPRRRGLHAGRPRHLPGD